jgi:hypothetical protein
MPAYHVAFGAYWVVVGSVLLWGMILERLFKGYLSRQHPGKWRTLLESTKGKPSLNWPGRPMSVSRFIWSSRDDFGDSEVGRYRDRLRRNRRILIVLFAGGLVGFGIYWWVLG